MTREGSGKGREHDREEAFAVFFNAHQRGVESFVEWRIGRQMAEVDDVCIKVFSAAFESFDRLGDLPFVQVRGWLVVTARNICANVLRLRGRQDRAYGRAAAVLEHEPYDPFDDVWLDALADDGLVCV
ncbi:MAG: hypothetical protein QM733_21310 [Ilumatobacteraceae bacterium]